MTDSRLELENKETKLRTNKFEFSQFHNNLGCIEREGALFLSNCMHIANYALAPVSLSISRLSYTLFLKLLDAKLAFDIIIKFT